MRALIDWLDTEIEQTKEKIKVFQEGHILQTVQIAILGKLEEVRLKCEKVEEPEFRSKDTIEFTTSGTSGDSEPFSFLSKTCINDWESNKYCANQNKCELCKIK